MSFQRAVLSLSYRPLVLFRTIRNAVNYGKRRGRLRVLLFHDILPEEYPHFQKQLEWLSKRWVFVGADKFAEMLTGSVPVEKDTLLLTFDDGFHSNRIISEKILGPMGIKALFFVISDFTKVDNRDEQLRFIFNRLFPGSVSDLGYTIPATMRNMTLLDLKYLVETGHTIGAHTTSHARLSSVNNEEQLVDEIVSGIDGLQEMLGIKINHFAFPFGNIQSFSRQALQVARQRFSYIYTGMRGNNLGSPPWAVRRDAISPKDSLALIGAFLEGAADPRYSGDLKTYQSWG